MLFRSFRVELEPGGASVVARIPRLVRIGERPALAWPSDCRETLEGERRAGAFLERRGVPYLDDPSNADPRFARTRVRALWPALEALDPRAAEHLAALGDDARAARSSLASRARRWQVRAEERGALRLSVLRAMAPAQRSAPLWPGWRHAGWRRIWSSTKQRFWPSMRGKRLKAVRQPRSAPMVRKRAARPGRNAPGLKAQLRIATTSCAKAVSLSAVREMLASSPKCMMLHDALQRSALNLNRQYPVALRAFGPLAIFDVSG